LVPAGITVHLHRNPHRSIGKDWKGLRERRGLRGCDSFVIRETVVGLHRLRIRGGHVAAPGSSDRKTCARLTLREVFWQGRGRARSGLQGLAPKNAPLGSCPGELAMRIPSPAEGCRFCRTPSFRSTPIHARIVAYSPPQPAPQSCRVGLFHHL
jgi:hypothetical protein